MYSNTVEFFNPFWASMAKTETAKRWKEETGLDLAKSLQMKCHYAGTPQVVSKNDWCHQWKPKTI